MEVTYALSSKEYLHIVKKLTPSVARYIVSFAIAFGVCIGVISHTDFWSISFGIILGILLLIFVPIYQRRHLVKLGSQRGLLSPQTVILGEEGATVLVATAQSKYLWEGITNVSQDQHYIYLYLSPVGRAKRAITIPKRAFQDPQSHEAFFKFAQSLHHNCRSH